MLAAPMPCSANTRAAAANSCPMVWSRVGRVRILDMYRLSFHKSNWIQCCIQLRKGRRETGGAHGCIAVRYRIDGLAGGAPRRRAAAGVAARELHGRGRRIRTDRDADLRGIRQVIGGAPRRARAV